MPNGHAHQSRTALTLAALGIVYGDIGTSPLYAVKETFNPRHGIPLGTETILGGLSTIFWSLMLVVSVKYVWVIMRADNRGEGGIMALLALASSAVREHPAWRTPVLIAGLLGASLFFGDAVLTPAISVLSAVEGLKIGTSAFTHYVVPISMGVLIALFLFQRHGTATVGKMFGPITLTWFLALAASGVYGILQHPGILLAINPMHALTFLTQHGFASFAVLGAVLLAFTGAEALYADMGHFGRGPIRATWFGLVMPALLLNYFGQGALLAVNPDTVANPFYLLLPQWALYPMVVLATAATVIASQAVISGTYSVTRQATQLNFLPRMNTVQTSAGQIGQIYMPGVNWLLLVFILAAVVGFGSSSNLAAAYGVAVTGTMMADTFLVFFVMLLIWRFSLVTCLALIGLFLTVDLAFFSSSLLKVMDGGWFPLALGSVMFMVLLTWRRGRADLLDALREYALPLEQFLQSVFIEPPVRVDGTAIFLTAAPEVVPHALLHNLKHNKVLHERLVFLTVKVRDIPWVPPSERVSVQPLGNNCWRVLLYYGFMDRPDVPQALTELCPANGLRFDMMETSFFLTRDRVIPVPGKHDRMAPWRERLFAAMMRNARSVVEYFNIPVNRVIELGTQIEI